MIKDDFKKIITTVANLFQREGVLPGYEIITKGEATLIETGSESYSDGYVNLFTITLEVPLDVYSKFGKNISDIEESIKNKLNPLMRKYPDEYIEKVIITPLLSEEIVNDPYKVSNDLLIESLEAQKNIMISVATRGPQIQAVNNQYRERYDLIDIALTERNIKNPNPFTDLWEWYGRWSSGDLPSYQSRREYINKIFSSLVRELKQNSEMTSQKIFSEPTGWSRVDRSLAEIRIRLSQAQNEEQYQTIGLLCRETLISLSQIVFDLSKHEPLDGVSPSKTDAKRMLEAYLTHVVPGATNEAMRRHAKAALSFANDLTHKRTANFREAALCAEATTSIINTVAIISGQRDKNKIHV